ncbi:PilW family protein [Parahaliea aestuarii]|uniref:Prepilin-type N-terminal cleavage/methylation domain-containing protein n=1 Tax=Parahaliea aestuarii TaxID=1852021 RepID=A0A5C8ZRP6_9GAMM|nr:PilW family protein [Parahaliea aestuarii]TXS90031.1 hypothetical protein FVW59_15625 [Parahaliea aestuarii]
MSARRNAIFLPPRLRGLSLIELMIAMTLGLLLLSGLILVYLESRRQALLEAEGARLQQSGRYALSLLQHELTMAGFFGGWPEPGLLAADAGAPGCGGLAGWALAPEPALDLIADIQGEARRSVHGHDLGCLPTGSGAIAQATDVLVIKRSAAQATLENGAFAAGISAAEASQWYLRIGHGGAAWRYVGEGENFPAVDRAPASGVSYWEVYASIFFIRPWSQPGDGVPTLCVERLSANSVGPVECLVDGVEDLQLSIGIDSNGDGSAERFTDNPDAVELQRARTARVALLLRSLAPVPGHRRSLEEGDGGGLDQDGYLRRWFSGTVNLHNLNLPQPVQTL